MIALPPSTVVPAGCSGLSPMSPASASGPHRPSRASPRRLRVHAALQCHCVPGCGLRISSGVGETRARTSRGVLGARGDHGVQAAVAASDGDRWTGAWANWRSEFVRSERPEDRDPRSLLASRCSHPTRRTTLPPTPTSDWIAPVRVAPPHQASPQPFGARLQFVRSDSARRSGRTPTRSSASRRSTLTVRFAARQPVDPPGSGMPETGPSFRWATAFSRTRCHGR